MFMYDNCAVILTYLLLTARLFSIPVCRLCLYFIVREQLIMLCYLEVTDVHMLCYMLYASSY